MDDVAFPLIAPAPRLARQVADALSIIHATFRSFLLEVNLAVGNTEVLLHVCGAGAPAARRDVFIDRNAIIE